jgi:hypothetical protein
MHDRETNIFYVMLDTKSIRKGYYSFISLKINSFTSGKMPKTHPPLLCNINKNILLLS